MIYLDSHFQADYYNKNIGIRFVALLSLLHIAVIVVVVSYFNIWYAISFLGLHTRDEYKI